MALKTFQISGEPGIYYRPPGTRGVTLISGPSELQALAKQYGPEERKLKENYRVFRQRKGKFKIEKPKHITDKEHKERLDRLKIIFDSLKDSDNIKKEDIKDLLEMLISKIDN